MLRLFKHLQELIKSSQIKSITNYKTISQLNISKPINYEALNNFEKLIKLTEIILEELADRFDDQRANFAEEFCDLFVASNPFDRFKYFCFLAEYYCKKEFKSKLLEITNLSETNQTSGRFDPISEIRDRIGPKKIDCSFMNFFLYLSQLNFGIKFLVDFRSDLVVILSNSILQQELLPYSRASLRLMSSQLSEQLSLWFNNMFVHFDRITWNSSASLLQKITTLEAVHPFRNWLDLKQRLGNYRRCYIYSHPSISQQPLVILHVALLPSISSSIQAIIQWSEIRSDIPGSIRSKVISDHCYDSKKSFCSAEDEIESPTIITINDKRINFGSSTRNRSNENYQSNREDLSLIKAANFYSISSTQKGLAGIDLSHRLIKHATASLKSEFPFLTEFSSLSPIPNFTEYLLWNFKSILKRKIDPMVFNQIWFKYSNFDRLKQRFSVENELDLYSKIIPLIQSGDWAIDLELVELLKKPLMHLCAHYLYTEKRRGYALNQVVVLYLSFSNHCFSNTNVCFSANFHLKNGAVLWRLNWLADISSGGLRTSCGLMVNYRYFLDICQENSLLYTRNKTIVTGEQFEQYIP
ncbi:malonyl-CoA decarboxylase, mitochondrial-like protein [Sarcoptes scabiei]|uniref:Malonyl-CoA decarboxylase, mitochondrial-like protein n=1 Tax=Sarcoptes scabiei TaxID=52283 RepID=A0A132AHF0_SARSC|nr:malonyl-CoA decarboxylase, mitochondrial-like protein [Sarcoptes scabiei]